jgi:NAD(P)H-hydrate repair Nnr-like enzyme with NAD(P)H-hydrate epimerase domain
MCWACEVCTWKADVDATRRVLAEETIENACPGMLYNTRWSAADLGAYLVCGRGHQQASGGDAIARARCVHSAHADVRHEALGEKLERNREVRAHLRGQLRHALQSTCSAAHAWLSAPGGRAHMHAVSASG